MPKSKEFLSLKLYWDKLFYSPISPIKVRYREIVSLTINVISFFIIAYGILQYKVLNGIQTVWNLECMEFVGTFTKFSTFSFLCVFLTFPLIFDLYFFRSSKFWLSWSKNIENLADFKTQFFFHWKFGALSGRMGRCLEFWALRPGNPVCI